MEKEERQQEETTVDLPDLQVERESAGDDATWEQTDSSSFPFARYYVDYATLVVVLLLSVFPRLFMTPNQMFLPTGLQSSSYPYDPQDTVPDWMMIVACIVFPLLLFGASFYYNRSIHLLHHALMGLVNTMAFVLLFTEVAKFNVGRYRPDYFGRLATGSEGEIETGQLSFPSGHASTSFGCFVYLSLYICGQLRLFHPSSGEIWKFIISLVPVALATWVALTRVTDYRHHPSDIVAGACIGVGMAFPSYFLFFPSLLSNEPDKPKSRG
mmetsp:Transcript_39496/g.62447  ORF Transcript_39496/g.62447 Transcript_39496/m.62447 type:complete len:269 (-) Transcript_39496:33-839(-)